MARLLWIQVVSSSILTYENEHNNSSKQLYLYFITQVIYTHVYLDTALHNIISIFIVLNKGNAEDAF